MKITEISVTSKTMGWGTKESDILIKPPTDESLSECHVEGEFFSPKGYTCSVEAVDEFFNAVSEPPIPEYDFFDMGFTQSWLEENLNEALKDLQDISEAQKELYTNTFLDVQKVHNGLRYYFGSSWTDDYPEIRVEIIIMDEPDIVLKSTSQTMHMLPWKIRKTNDIKTIKTYNPRISRALANLLPDRFVSKERLSDSLLKTNLHRGILSQISDEWSVLHTTHQMGSLLDPIKKEYILKSAGKAGIYITGIGHIDILKLMIGHKNWSKNVFIEASIAYDEENNTLKDLQLFLDTAPKLVENFFSVEWFVNYVKTHEEVEVKIQYELDKSLGDVYMEGFWNNMFKCRKEPVRDIVKQHHQEVVYIIIFERIPDNFYSSQWIILPDGRVILYTFNGNKVLKWKAEEIDSLDEYQNHLAGVIISKDGTINDN